MGAAVWTSNDHEEGGGLDEQKNEYSELSSGVLAKSGDGPLPVLRRGSISPQIRFRGQGVTHGSD
jgi:hypothetical protein